MNINLKFYTFIFTLYIIFYKTILIFKGETATYIIHPLIIIIFSIIGYIFFYKDKYYKNQGIYLYEVIRSSLIYVFFFYSAGLIIGYSTNPYSRSFDGIIINFFSILLVTGLKEFIRGTIINEVSNHKLPYFALIWTIFVILDLNFILIKTSLIDFNSLLLTLIIYMTPVLSINLFCTYLCVNSGFISSFIYRTVLLSISLIIPVVSDFHPIIPTLFDTLIPFFTYLIIRNHINKRIKDNKMFEEINPKNWIITFLFLTFSLLFITGTFSIKPVVVLSGSMKPNINEGDLLIINKCSIESIENNDIIEFNIGEYKVIHRVIRIINNSENIKLITKGDNNPKVDKDFVQKENLEGCLSLKIPYIGYPTYLFKSILNKLI